MTIIVSDYQTLHAPFGNEESIARVRYDFSKDAGTAGAFSLFEADGDIVITDFFVNVLTAFDSAGDAAVIDIGITGGDTDALVQDAGQARFALGSFVKADACLEGGSGEVRNLPLKVADNAVVAMVVKTAALTAGKCDFFFKYVRLAR